MERVICAYETKIIMQSRIRLYSSPPGIQGIDVEYSVLLLYCVGVSNMRSGG